MKVDLEKYIIENRSALNQVESVDADSMWEEFNQRRKPVRKLKPFYYLAAAMLIILIGIGFLFSPAKELSMDELVAEKLNQTDPILATEQEHLMQLINSQGLLINQMGIDEGQFPDLFEEIKSLDRLQLEAINDLENLGDRKNLMRTLLRYYERKARVLELMIYEFEKQENETKYESAKQI